MNTLVHGSLVVRAQEDCADLSMHRHDGEGPRVGLTWSSLLDLLTNIRRLEAILWLLQVSGVQQFLSQTDQMDSLILGSLVIESQEESATLAMHCYRGKGLRVDLTWSSSFDLLARLLGGQFVIAPSQ